MQLPPRRPNLGPARHPSPHTLISGPGQPPYGDRASPIKRGTPRPRLPRPMGPIFHPIPDRSEGSIPTSTSQVGLFSPDRHRGGPRARSTRTSSRKAKEVHLHTPFYTRYRTLHNTLKLFPLLSLLVQFTDSCVNHSCHCHAACAYLLKFFSHFCSIASDLCVGHPIWFGGRADLCVRPWAIISAIPPFGSSFDSLPLHALLPTRPTLVYYVFCDDILVVYTNPSPPIAELPPLIID